MERGEWELELRLRGASPEDAAPVVVRDQVVQESRLPEAGGSSHDEYCAVARARGRQQLSERRPFGLAADERPPRVRRLHDHHSRIERPGIANTRDFHRRDRGVAGASVLVIEKPMPRS